MSRWPPLSKRFDEVTADLNADGLSKLADDLASVAKLLSDETVLNRHLAEPTENPEPKTGMLEALLSDKVGDDALEILKTAVSQRWSAESDLTEAVQHVARLALLVRAERDGEVEEVEDQLFRFSRILDSQPKLNTLLSDNTTPLEGRIGLLDNVLDGKVNATAGALLRRRSSCCTTGMRTRPYWNWPNLRWPVAARSSRTSVPPPISATLSATGSPRCSAASTATRCRSSYT